MIDLMQHKGLEIVVMKKEGFKDTNCLGCTNLEDTGFSWICTATGEKLEGFDTKQDKLDNNLETFLPKHMGIGVGFKCPLPKVCGKFTDISELFEEKEFCVEDSSEECGECGLCGKEITGRCCMNPMKVCDGCMEC